MLCRGCNRDQPESGFTTDRSKPSGKASRCKECRRIYHTEWRHREENRVRLANYYARYEPTPEAKARARELARRRYAANPEKYRAEVAAWRAIPANREKGREASVANAIRWNREHPEKVLDTQRRRRAQKKGAELRHRVEAEVVYARDGYVCRLCDESTVPGGPYALRPSVDHIVPLIRGGEHSYINVQTAHCKCNSMKGDRLETELRLPFPALVLVGTPTE